MTEFVPVDHDPFAPAGDDPLIVPEHIMSPSPRAVAAAHGLVKGIADWARLPGRAMTPQQPVVPGQWSDVDESIRQLDDRATGDWAASTALATVGLPGAGAGRVAGAGKPLASKPPLVYNPPTKPPRPFSADYPTGAPADAAGRLLKDIEGRPLTAERVVGRTMVGGDEKALPTTLDTLNPLAEALTGRVPENWPAREMGQDLGRTFVDRHTGEPLAIHLSDDLAADDAAKVLAHEIGHAIDDIAGNIPTKGLSGELEGVYNTLQNPNRTRGGTDAASRAKPVRPQDLRYKPEEVPREYIVEAIRAYMADPNYLKTVAPETARAIRAAVNANPRLSKIIQFNSLAAAAGYELVPVDHDPFAP
jgi:hypothetical protein